MLIQFSPVGETRAVVPPQLSLIFIICLFILKSVKKRSPRAPGISFVFFLFYVSLIPARDVEEKLFRVGQQIIRISRNINQAKSEARGTTQDVLLPVWMLTPSASVYNAHVW
jgi:hypothetical protein